jgi:ribosomal protein S18 acetylase RimI-like enzyme
MTANDIIYIQQIANKTWHKTYKGIIPEVAQKQFIDRSYSYAMLQMRMK